ncbi:MAG: DUF4476 domain-containing protein [Chitinophagaceae bacterium]
MKLKLLIWLCFVVKLSFAQQYFFVLIENAEKQPFVVKANNKTYSGNHFITIPKLTKGQHEFVIETSKEQRQVFLINIDADDIGFVLKPSPDKGLVLFDINSFKTLAPMVKTESDVVKQEIPKQEPPKQEIIAKEEAKPIVPKIEEVKKEVITPTKVADVKPILEQQKVEEKPVIAKVDEAKKEIINLKNGSRKIFENTNAKGIDQIFVVENGEKLDTVAIFIPQLNAVTTKETPKIAEPAPKVEVTAKSDDVPTKNIYANPSCTSLVSTPLFEQILQLVGNEATDKAKFNKATGFLNKDCFSTNQIKQIGSQFANDYYKFDFYRVAKKMVLDLQNFPSLKSTIKEEKVQEMFTDLLNN